LLVLPDVYVGAPTAQFVVRLPNTLVENVYEVAAGVAG